MIGIKHMNTRILALGLLAAAAAPGLFAASAGPDKAGYLASDATVFSFVDIASTGARALAAADDETARLPLGFSFRFYGQTYTEVCASSNGVLSFGGCGTGDFANIDLASQAPGGNLPTIAPFWTDLTFDAPGADALYYEIVGTAPNRRFIVQWNNALPIGGGGAVTFQVILYESTNRILFQYADVDAGAGMAATNGGAATIGIRDASGQTNGRQIAWSCNAPVLRNMQAIEFVPPSSTDPNSNCVPKLSPPSAAFDAPAGRGSFTLALPSACSWNAASAAPWIALAGTASGTGNAVLSYTVAENPTPGARTGTITVAGAPFTITQGPGRLKLSASVENLAFATEIGGPVPVPQSFQVEANGTGSITVDTGNAPWLRVTPRAAALPATLTASVDVTGLAAGNYTTVITIGAPGGDAISVSVRLTVSPKPRLLATAAGGVPVSSLDFEYLLNGPVPAARSVRVTSTTRNIGYSVATSGGAWLAAQAAAKGTPDNLSVSVNPAGLQPGRYQGTVTLSSADAAAPVTIAVTLSVGYPAPAITAGGIVNAAGFEAGPIAPGEIVSIFGAGIGPSSPALLALDDTGKVASRIGETVVYFDGVAAPLIAAQANQINAVVPYSVAGKQTVRVEVEYRGVRSAPLTVAVAASAPALFTRNSQGTGQASILNSDSTVNSPENAAEAGSIVVLYATGEGETDPQGIDGAVAAAGTLAKPKLPVTVQVGGVEAEVLYAGSAPELVAGVLQVNVRLPQGTPSGAVPIVLKIGDRTSRAGVTVSVR